MYNIEIDEYRQIYSYYAEIDFENAEIPVFCTDRKKTKIAFYEDGCIKEFDALTESLETGRLKKSEAPLYMSYLSSDERFLFISYREIAVLYDLKEKRELSTYAHKEFNFFVRGVQCGEKILFFDEMTYSHEWDIKNDRIDRFKYKNIESDTNGVYFYPEHSEVVIGFSNDSLVILNSNTGELLEALYYGEWDTKVGLMLYDNTRNCMAVLLETSQCEAIKYYDIATGNSSHSYYEFSSRYKIWNIELSKISNYLLCSFDKKVSIIDLNSLELFDIYVAKNDKLIVNAHFLDSDDVQVILCETSKNGESKYTNPHILELRRKSNNTYVKSTLYCPPYISPELVKNFIPSTFGIREIDSKGGVDYLCLNSGIITEWTSEMQSALLTKKHIWDDEGCEVVAEGFPCTNDLFHICYDQSINFSRILHDKCGSDALAVEHDIFVVLTRCNNVFMEKSTMPKKRDFIEFCTMTEDGKIFGVCDGNSIFFSDNNSGKRIVYPHYTPGLIVAGCDFRNARMSKSLHDVLMLHGGLMT